MTSTTDDGRPATTGCRQFWAGARTDATDAGTDAGRYQGRGGPQAPRQTRAGARSCSAGGQEMGRCDPRYGADILVRRQCRAGGIPLPFQRYISKLFLMLLMIRVDAGCVIFPRLGQASKKTVLSLLK